MREPSGTLPPASLASLPRIKENSPASSCPLHSPNLLKLDSTSSNPEIDNIHVLDTASFVKPSTPPEKMDLSGKIDSATLPASPTSPIPLSNASTQSIEESQACSSTARRTEGEEIPDPVQPLLPKKRSLNSDGTDDAALAAKKGNLIATESVASQAHNLTTQLNNRYSNNNQGPFVVYAQSDDRKALHLLTIGKILNKEYKKDLLEVKKLGYSKVSVALKKKEICNDMVSKQPLKDRCVSFYTFVQNYSTRYNKKRSY